MGAVEGGQGGVGEGEGGDVHQYSTSLFSERLRGVDM